MKFYKGQKVVCINDKFNKVYSTKKKKLVLKGALLFPKKGTTLIVDQVINYSGQTWLNFDEFDTGTRLEWWVAMQFRPLDDFSITLGGIDLNRALSLLE
ncbi:MAG: hypothetical protein ABIN67_19355 [Ferruginibacter sp.]